MREGHYHIMAKDGSGYTTVKYATHCYAEKAMLKYFGLAGAIEWIDAAEMCPYCSGNFKRRKAMTNQTGSV